jgi:very-short-patch-repair endonuclease
VLDLIAAYLPKMAPPEFFSHRTAALLHDMWLPFDEAERLRLDVAVVPPARAPRDARVFGHHLVDRPGLVEHRDGLRLATAAETWCQLATLLPLAELIAAGDSLLAKGRRGPDLRPALLAAADDRNRPCSGRLLEAIALVRPGVRSAQETKLRLLLIDAGLPEPEVNGDIHSPFGAFVAECDLVYRRARVVVEYEGDYHRTDQQTWRSDIVRYERLQELGWRVIRVTADDLRLRPAETVARVRAALAGR